MSPWRPVKTPQGWRAACDGPLALLIVFDFEHIDFPVDYSPGHVCLFPDQHAAQAFSDALNAVARRRPHTA